MIRKIKRSVARYNLYNQDIPIFGKYAPVKTKVYDKRKRKIVEKEVQKSYFSRIWRSWC